MTVDARAATVRTQEVGRTGSALDVTASESGLSHTTPDTWVTTLTRMTVGTTWMGTHDVSKPRVTVASWRAERRRRMTIGAPHRGQCQAGVAEDVSEGGDARCSRRRASARCAVRQVLAR